MAGNSFDPKQFSRRLGMLGTSPALPVSAASDLPGTAPARRPALPVSPGLNGPLRAVGTASPPKPALPVSGAVSDLFGSLDPWPTLPVSGAASDLFPYPLPTTTPPLGAAMPAKMRLRVWDVEHGACVMLQHVVPTLAGDVGGKLAMIDSGDSAHWSPSSYIRYGLGRTMLDYLFITNADQDHMSDLRGLAHAGVTVNTLHRNTSYTGAMMRAIKLGSGPLTGDAEWYVAACDSFNVPTSRPFDQCMNGITCATFCNSFPRFVDTNNLSLAVFIRYAGTTFLFPGDLERDGWRALLERAEFRAWLATVDVLMASHHGRENGYCEQVFEICRPQAVVISDKPIVHDTQRMVDKYRAVVTPQGVVVRTTMKHRHVLTTRRDGWIQFEANDNGNFVIDTERQG